MKMYSEPRGALRHSQPAIHGHSPLAYDFANILFAGPCNARCPFCIGKQVDPRLNARNLDVFPPKNLDAFLELIGHYAIRQVVFTGTTTDPQLYCHETRLLGLLRRELHPETQISLHTNGRLALRRMDVFNLYDRVCISFPSFAEDTYRRMMGVARAPDLETILLRARTWVKVSCVVTDENRFDIPAFLARCQAIGVGRLVLRKLHGERRAWAELIPVEELAPFYRHRYRNNPVYNFDGMEVTLWDFEATTSRSINLFADGTISNAYRLMEATPERSPVAA